MTEELKKQRLDDLYQRQKEIQFGKKIESNKLSALNKDGFVNTEISKNKVHKPDLYIEKIKETINNYNIELKEIESEIDDIKCGEYDDDFLDEFEENQNKARIFHEKQTKLKHILADKLSAEQKELNDERRRKRQHKETKTNENYDNLLEKEMKFTYDRPYTFAIDEFYGRRDAFIKNDKLKEQLKNMRENLKEMPNNKGYLWKGCIFYGDKKPEYLKNGEIAPIVIFENLKGGILRTHESTPSHRRIFDKKKGVKGERPVLVKSELRRKIEQF